MKTKIILPILCLLGSFYMVIVPPHRATSSPGYIDTLIAHAVLEIDSPELDRVNKPVDDKIEDLNKLNKSINRDSKSIHKETLQIQAKMEAIQPAPSQSTDTVVVLLPADSVPIKHKGFLNRIRSLFKRK